MKRWLKFPADVETFWEVPPWTRFDVETFSMTKTLPRQHNVPKFGNMPTWKRFDVETFCGFAASKRFWGGERFHVANVSTSKRFHVGNVQNFSTSENVSTSGRQRFVPGAILIRCQICCDFARRKNVSTSHHVV